MNTYQVVCDDGGKPFGPQITLEEALIRDYNYRGLRVPFHVQVTTPFTT